MFEKPPSSLACARELFNADLKQQPAERYRTIFRNQHFHHIFNEHQDVTVSRSER